MLFMKKLTLFFAGTVKTVQQKKSKKILEFIFLKSTLLPKVRVLSNFAFLPKNNFVYENFEKLEKSSFITVVM